MCGNRVTHGSTTTVCAQSAMRKTAFALAVASMLLVTTLAMTACGDSKSNRISISYVPPKDPELRHVYMDLKERRVLEKYQKFLSPFRLPRTLKITLAGCDGESDAFYGDDEITICYEYVEALWTNAPAETTPAGIAPIDTVAGPFFDTCLHEFAHALFDMHNLPVFGREEDAADQVEAYALLQFGESEARRLIAGTAYAYHMDEKKIDPCRSMEDYAKEHGTPAQRFFNVLCIAYGADTKLFGDIVSKGYLPKSRAEYCEEEYEQVQDAVDLLIIPHIDLDFADKIMGNPWLQEPEQ